MFKHRRTSRMLEVEVVKGVCSLNKNNSSAILKIYFHCAFDVIDSRKATFQYFVLVHRYTICVFKHLSETFEFIAARLFKTIHQ